MIPRIVLALVVILWCSFAQARVVIYRSRTVVTSPPAVAYVAPPTAYVAPAPAADPVVIVNPWRPWLSVRSAVAVGPTGAQRRHARKAAEHAARAAYWAARS